MPVEVHEIELKLFAPFAFGGSNKISTIAEHVHRIYNLGFRDKPAKVVATVLCGLRNYTSKIY